MEGDQSVPLWTPDGSRLVFSSRVKGTYSVLSMNADGSGSATTLATSTVKGYPSAWTPDGSALLTLFDRQIRLVPRDGKTEPRPLPIPDIVEPDFSPDGRWLAYTSGSRASGRGQVYVQSYPALDRREQVSGENGTKPAWRRDGRELYYVEDASAGGGPLKIRMMAVPITTTPTFSAGAARMLFEGPFRIDGQFRTYDVTPDGQRFLKVQEIGQPAARLSHGACPELDGRADARSAGEVALLAEGACPSTW
jgi:dipeptidyl aminopeptidase/acylaminoacyl peptidase